MFFVQASEISQYNAYLTVISAVTIYERNQFKKMLKFNISLVSNSWNYKVIAKSISVFRHGSRRM